MARSRLPVVVSASWGGQTTDISAAVVSGRVEHGSGESNPDRSTIDVARGSMVLEGLAFQPGASTRWTAAQLSTRAAVTVSHGPVTAWQGWIDQPRLIPRAARPQTRYRLTGKLDEYATRMVEAVSSSSDLYADAELWAEVTGAAPRLSGASEPGLTFSPFQWKGRGFEFAGLAARIGGRLVGEDRLGRLTMPTFAQQAANLISVASSALLLGEVESDIDVEQIRNRLVVSYPADNALAVDGRSSQGAEVYETATQANLSVRESVALSVADGDTLGDVSVSVERAVALVAGTYHTWSGTRTGRSWNRAIPSVQEVDISGMVSASVAASGTTATVTATITPGPLSWSVDRQQNDRDIVAAPGSTSTPWRFYDSESWVTPREGDFVRFGPAAAPDVVRMLSIAGRQSLLPDVRRRIWALELTFRVSYETRTPAAQTLTLQSPGSQANWGIRPLEFLPWVLSTSTSRLQSDIDALAQPRTYFDVTLPLWQETAAKSAQVAALDYGDYLDLTLADARRGVSIDTVAVVTRRGVSWGVGRVPSVTLRLLEVTTAAPVTPPVATAPGPPRNLALAPTETTIAASWDAPNTGGAVASYSLRYRRQGTQAWAETVTGITGRSRTVTGLTGSTTVEVEVSAVNTAGASGWVRASATTSAPARALPIPGGLDIARDFGSLAQLSWTRVTVPGGETLRRYRTRHKAVSAAHWTEGTSSATSRYISGLQTGSQYEFQVRAEYASGDSDYSPSHQWTAGSAALPPDARRAGIITLDGAPILLDGAPITLT